MVLFELTLSGVAFASTIIATLRAGSRAVYLMGHDGIGIMNGPMILPPVISPSQQNVTDDDDDEEQRYPKGDPALYELSEAFRHAVRLSIIPNDYDELRMAQPAMAHYVAEQYSFSQRPSLDSLNNGRYNSDIPTTASPLDKYTQSSSSSTIDETQEDEEFDEEIRRILEEAAEIDDTMYSKSRLQRTNAFFRRRVDQIKRLPAGLGSLLRSTSRAVATTPNIAWYMTTNFWRRRYDKYDDFESDFFLESEFDYSLSNEAALHFHGPGDGTPRVAKLSVFAPDTFENLRSLFGISEPSYQSSIFRAGPFISFQSNSKGAARAGGLFFFTRDGAYMIKTIKKEEAKTLLTMLPKYHKHMRRHGRKSLLTRFCGMYGVRIHDEDSPGRGEMQTFIVMNAVFPAEGSSFISERFDLKGSTVGRKVSEEELQKKGSNAVLKDLDLAEEVELVRSVKPSSVGEATPVTNYGLCIGAKAKANLLSQLREDVKLLVECQVMDYSLLVGVVNMERNSKLDQSARKAIGAMRKRGRLIAASRKVEDRILYALGAPIRIVAAPPIHIARQALAVTQRTISSIVTFPLPYYGSGKCGVDGGLLSTLHGTRRGDRAIYYLGLIDFLQPWTTRKVFERRMKGLIGYDTKAISCVSPEEYASRFLQYLDAHLT